MVDELDGQRLIAETRLQRFERKIEKALKALLRNKEQEVLALTAAGDPFNSDVWPDQVTAGLTPVLNEILKEVQDDIEKKLGARPETIDVRGQLDRMLGHMENLGPDTARRLEAQIAESLDKGESVGKLKARIEEVFDIASRQAATIARTETAIAVSSFSYDSALALNNSGTPVWQTWLATSDSRTRATHLEADGQTVPITQPFTVGGASLLHPSDPNGPADEVINCRCTTTLSVTPPGQET